MATHNDLAQAFKSIQGLNLLGHSEAPHSGAHFFNFQCSVELLTKICQKMMHVKWHHINICVLYENGEITYGLYFPSGEPETIERRLEEIKSLI